MTINEFDKWLCDNYHVDFKMDGSDFSDGYRNGWVYIITFESGNAYRVFACDNGDNMSFGIQALAVHYYKDGHDYGYDEPCDYKWADTEYTNSVFDDCITICHDMNEWPALAKKWFDECEADGLFTQTINE